MHMSGDAGSGAEWRITAPRVDRRKEGLHNALITSSDVQVQEGFLIGKSYYDRVQGFKHFAQTFRNCYASVLQWQIS